MTLHVGIRGGVKWFWPIRKGRTSLTASISSPEAVRGAVLVGLRLDVASVRSGSYLIHNH
jgi:hypothetical protein